MHFAELLLGLALIWLAAKAAGEGAERLGQPAVLGELLAGVVVGPHALGWVDESHILAALAEIGVVILLFEIGLESDLEELLRAGVQSAAVAAVGIVGPFAAGYALGRWWGLDPLTAIFLGATLTATSVGITARVLADLGRLQDPAARVVLGAAVVDDVLGLVILAVVTGMAETGRASAGGALWVLVKAVAFLALATGLGIRLAPTLLRWVAKMRSRGALIVGALIFCMALAGLGEKAGLATIVGAFAAGLVLAKTEPRAHIEEALKPVADLFVPIFFVAVGMKVDLSALYPLGPEGGAGLALAALLAVAAIGSKLLAGVAVWTPAVRRWPVAVGMVPRGEVGLIFAGMGLAAGVMDAGLYAAVVATVMVSTLVVPPWLKLVYAR